MDYEMTSRFSSRVATEVKWTEQNMSPDVQCLCINSHNKSESREKGLCSLFNWVLSQNS